MATRQSDKNLLFSIVMLRNGFIDDSQFAQLVNDWVQDNTKPISQLAVDRGWLDVEDTAAIERLVERQVSKHGNVEASISHHSRSKELRSLRFIDESVWGLIQNAGESATMETQVRSSSSASANLNSMTQTSVSSNNHDTDYSEGTPNNNSATTPSRGDVDDFSLNQRFEHGKSELGKTRYSILRPHAKGGLGKVSVALDTELDREVALKEIRSTYAKDKISRERFVLEACITGGLEHPGVVPVYGFGKNEDGSPYFAMRFIRGQTLKEAVIAYHKEHQRGDSPQKRMEFRNLLSRFVDACNALAYAHNRGVIHRDIKPSNVMLGKFGETLVVDWGLAKKTGREEEHIIDDESSIALNGAAVSGTLDGSTVGTPTFMSPEQAAGKLHKMRPASDIYSLGSTLYFILTGKTAFSGSSATEVVAQVCENHFRPPHEVSPAVPAALSSICSKAMSTRPIDRYATALQLGADVEAWMADEPVSAHEESSIQKVGRWLRRHRTFATSAAVLALTLTTASLIGMYMVNAEKNRTVAAKQKTETALSELEVAQAATAIALKSETNARRQTREVLNTVTDEFVGELLARSVGLEDQDRKFFDRVLAQYEELTSTAGDTPEARNIRADGYLRVGNLQRRLDDLDAAAVAYGNAESIWTTLADSSDDPNYRRDLAEVLGNHAMLLSQRGRHKLAIEKESRANEILDALVTEFPEKVNFKLDHAGLLSNRGNKYARIGEFEKSELDHDQAIAILEALKNKSDDRRVRKNHAFALSNLAGLFTRQKERLNEAEKIYRQVIQELDELVETKTDPKLERRVAVERQNLGRILLRLKRNDEAITQFKEAIETQAALVKKYPTLAVHRRDLSLSRYGLGQAMNKFGIDGSNEELIKAKALTNELVSAFPARVEFKRDLANIFEQLGSHYRKTDKVKASEMYAKGLDLRSKIEDLDPQNVLYSDQSIAAEINFANYLRLSEEFEGAIERYQSVRKKLENRENPSAKLVRVSLFGLGDSCVKAARYAEALDCWEQLVKNKKDPAFVVFQLQRAICSVRVGKVEQGIEIADEVLENDADPKGIIYYDVACCHAVAAKEDTDEGNKERYAKQAVELLKQAGQKDFFDKAMRAHAAKDVDLVVLHDRPDFKELCGQYDIELSGTDKKMDAEDGSK